MGGRRTLAQGPGITEAPLRQSDAKRWRPQPRLLAGRQVGHRAGWGARHGTGWPHRVQAWAGSQVSARARARALRTCRWRLCPPGPLWVMEPRAGGATDPRGSRGGTGVGVRWARPRRTSPRLSAPSRSLRTGGKQGSLVPGQRWRWRRLQTGAKRPGLGSRPPISTRTRATGLRTSSGGSQESLGRCAGGVCSGSLGMPEHFTVCGEWQGLRWGPLGTSGGQSGAPAWAMRIA